jgi:hypothetical protein
MVPSARTCQASDASASSSTYYDAATDAIYPWLPGQYLTRFQLPVSMTTAGWWSTTSISGIIPAACAAMNTGNITCTGGTATVRFLPATYSQYTDPWAGASTNTYPVAPAFWPT